MFRGKPRLEESLTSRSEGRFTGKKDLLEESEIYTPAFSEAYNFNIEIQFYGKFTGCGLPTGVNWTYRRLEIWCADLTCFDLLCLSQVSPGFNWFQRVVLQFWFVNLVPNLHVTSLWLSCALRYPVASHFKFQMSYSGIATHDLTN